MAYTVCRNGSRKIRVFLQTMITVIIAVSMLIATSLADEKCDGGMISQELCQKTCNFTSCYCGMTDTSPFNSCSQKCQFSASCPVMDCSGKNACAQKCFFGECNMKCASSQFCSQSCVWKSRCGQVTCSSAVCHQVCANCTMECTRGVEACEQMCLGGVCDMKCQAKHCKRKCFRGKCNYIGQSRSEASILQSSMLVVLTVFSRLLSS